MMFLMKFWYPTTQLEAYNNESCMLQTLQKSGEAWISSVFKHVST